MRISDWSSDVCSSDLRGHYRGIPWQGWTQLLLGLCVPPLIAEHALGTRAAHAVLGLNDSYAYVLIVQFVQEPLIGLRSNLVILIARSEERRVGKERSSTCRSRWSP